MQAEVDDHKYIHASDKGFRVGAVGEFPENKKVEGDVGKHKNEVPKGVAEQMEAGENPPLVAADGIHFVHKQQRESEVKKEVGEHDSRLCFAQDKPQMLPVHHQFPAKTSLSIAYPKVIDAVRLAAKVDFLHPLRGRGDFTRWQHLLAQAVVYAEV